MLTNLSEIKLERWTRLIVSHLDETRDDLVHKMKALQPSITRVLWVIVGEAVICFSIFLGYIFILFFSHTSYRFVSLFLLFILVSNVLAKIAVKFIETSND